MAPTLEAELERSLAVEASSSGADGADGTSCGVDGCQAEAGWMMQVHRRHSRRASEDLELCSGHLADHCEGEVLRLRVESNL